MFTNVFAVSFVLVAAIGCHTVDAGVEMKPTAKTQTRANICAKDNIDMFLMNNSVHLWYDQCHREIHPDPVEYTEYSFNSTRKPTSFGISVLKRTLGSGGSSSTICKPQCNLVLHKTGCLSSDGQWSGHLCPSGHPPKCSLNRFACSRYNIADVGKSLRICEENAMRVKKCSEQGDCSSPSVYSSRGNCIHAQKTYTNHTISGYIPIIFPMSGLHIQNYEVPLNNMQEGIYIRTFAASEEIIESLQISLFDRYVVLFRDFGPCLDELFQSNRIVFLYLPERGQIFEFGFSNSTHDTLSVCTLATSDRRLFVSNILMVTGTILSITGLVVTIFSVFLTSEHLNIPGINLLFLSCSLITTYMTVVIAKMVRGATETCFPEGLLHVVSILASLAWMNVMAFDIWSTLSKMYPMNEVSSLKNKKKLIRYCCYGWGLPTFIVLTGIMADNLNAVPVKLKPRFSLQCWFMMGFNTWGTVLFYYGPIAVMLSFNLVLFLLTAKLLFDSHSETARDKPKQHRKLKYLFKLYIKLFLVMGLTWMLEVANLFVSIPELMIANDFINTLQGLFISIIFACKPKVLKAFCYHCCPSHCSNLTEADLRSLRGFSSVASSRKSSFDQNNCKLITCSKV